MQSQRAVTTIAKREEEAAEKEWSGWKGFEPSTANLEVGALPLSYIRTVHRRSTRDLIVRFAGARSRPLFSSLIAGRSPRRQARGRIAGVMVTLTLVRRQPALRLAQRADPELAEELTPAQRRPGEPGVGRQRAQVMRLGGRVLVAGLLHRIVVEGRDLVRRHAVAGEPARDVDVAEPLDVGEHLVGAGAGRRAGGAEGVAD